MAANIDDFDFDPDKLRQKYKEERDNVFVQMETSNTKKLKEIFPILLKIPM